MIEMSTLSSSQARNIIRWMLENGHTKEEAYEAVIAALEAELPKENEKEDSESAK